MLFVRKKKEEAFKLTKPLRHLAFIMDGNGRWAKQHLLPRSMGHRAGVKNIKTMCDLCFEKYDIYAVSLFAFSTENWNRPSYEISYLFKLLTIFFRDNVVEFKQKGIKIVVSGDLTDKRIPIDTINTINNAIEETKKCSKHIFNVLYDYGGRREIANSAQKIASEVLEGKLKIADIDEKCIQNHLYQPDLPDVDLLIRTSGEYRISNCQLYEVAYAEMIFTPIYWPAFSGKDLVNCLKEYETRNRRFGGLKNE